MREGVKRERGRERESDEQLLKPNERRRVQTSSSSCHISFVGHWVDVFASSECFRQAMAALEKRKRLVSFARSSSDTSFCSANDRFSAKTTSTDLFFINVNNHNQYFHTFDDALSTDNLVSSIEKTPSTSIQTRFSLSTLRVTSDRRRPVLILILISTDGVTLRTTNHVFLFVRSRPDAMQQHGQHTDIVLEDGQREKRNSEHRQTITPSFRYRSTVFSTSRHGQEGSLRHR